jgi:hypothetical protein
MDLERIMRGVLSHMVQPAFVFVLVPRGALLNLEKLTLDGTHPGHQTIEFCQKMPLVLLGLLDEIRRGTVANALKGVRELPIQKPHMVLQIQELLVKLGLLEHGRDLTRERSVLNLSYSAKARSSRTKKEVPANFLTAKLKHRAVFTVL